MKVFRPFFGVWLGANLLAFPLAWLLLFMLTGRLAVWVRGRPALLYASEVEDALQNAAERMRGRRHV